VWIYETWLITDEKCCLLILLSCWDRRKDYILDGAIYLGPNYRKTGWGNFGRSFGISAESEVKCWNRAQIFGFRANLQVGRNSKIPRFCVSMQVFFRALWVLTKGCIVKLILGTSTMHTREIIAKYIWESRYMNNFLRIPERTERVCTFER